MLWETNDVNPDSSNDEPYLVDLALSVALRYSQSLAFLQTLRTNEPYGFILRR